jgi:tetratricopeptide (TPR) repeat protein
MRRLQLVFAAVVAALSIAAPAAAQTARARGVVRDTSGRPIRSALVRAVNDQAAPSEVTSTTDDKGRFAMIGLASGTWTFIAEAPGFVAARAQVPVRIAGTPPLTFALSRDPGPLPNALDRNIAEEIADANALRDQGQYDQAIAAYRQLRTRNPTLTSLALVLGDTYRRKAERETDAATRQTLFDLALSTYGEALKSDATSARAQAEIETTRAEALRAASGQTR